MQEDMLSGHPVDELPDPGRDLVLAQQAVEYLRTHGLDDGAVIQCLRDEFEIDLATAEIITSRSGRESGMARHLPGGTGFSLDST